MDHEIDFAVKIGRTTSFRINQPKFLELGSELNVFGP